MNKKAYGDNCILSSSMIPVWNAKYYHAYTDDTRRLKSTC